MHNNRSTSTNGHRPWRVHIIGAGPMGSTVAIALATLAEQMRLKILIYLYERAAYGGGLGDWAATIASHAWEHRDGQFYSTSQPEVSVNLQHSTRRLRKLVPYAFTDLLAFTVDFDGTLPRYFEPLGIWHRPVPVEVARCWLARFGMQLPAHAQLVRVRDAVIDTRLLGYGLMREAARLGVHLVHQGCEALELHGDSICALRLSHGERVPLQAEDHVVLACGARMRSLLASVGMHIPGLRLFGSQLLGADLGVRALFTAIGSVSIIPHEEGGGLVNVVGNANRRELTDAESRRPAPDPAVTWQTRLETEELYGLRLPEAVQAWVGVKTEITAGKGSQAYHAHRVASLANGWYCLPGKLSQTAACAASLSRKLLRQMIKDPVAWPIWETLPAVRATRAVPTTLA